MSITKDSWIKPLKKKNAGSNTNKSRKLLIKISKTEKGKINRNVERYLVDYVKFKIKDPYTPADRKFRALLLLKDLMNKRHKILVDYTEKKILKRLYLLAKSPHRENVLIIYDKRADLKYSKNFYTLLLECLDNWALKYGATNPAYISKRNRLMEMRVLPVPTNFYNVPGSDDEHIYDNVDNLDSLSLGHFIRGKSKRVTYGEK